MASYTDGKFDKYQEEVIGLAVYPEVRTGSTLAVAYTGLGLAGEGGEVANKIKKTLRGDKSLADPEVKKAVAKEIGGVLWYAAALAAELGFSLSYIADLNIEELRGRRERGTIKGDGDNR